MFSFSEESINVILVQVDEEEVPTRRAHIIEAEPIDR